MPPTNPLIYRFYELVQTYRTTWKAMLEEEFGDGIMGAIDFDMQIERASFFLTRVIIQSLLRRQIT